MPRTIFLQLFISLSASSLLAQNSGFVSLAGRNFILDGEAYYPRVMNFGTEIVAMNTPVSNVSELWSSIETSADWAFQQYEPVTQTGFQQQIADHFAKIRSMGFNAVRLGLPVLMHWDPPGGVRRYSIVYYGHVQWTRYFLDLDMNGYHDDASTRHFELIRELIRSADSEGLKVILVCAEDLGGQTQLTPATDALAAQHYADYLTRLAEELREEPGLLAYDLWNEPIWTSFAMAAIDKATVCDYTSRWYDAIRATGDRHLITLGGSSLSELGSWDPAIMKLDFYSPHIYPEFSRLDGYDRQGGFDRFAAKLHWQSRSCPIPWLIGETAFAADDDAADPMDLHNNDPTPILVADPRTKRMPYMMGSEQDQADFFTHSMDAVRATKGSGYSWWGFQNGRGHPLVRPENFDLTILDPETGESVHKSLVEKYHHNFWGPLKYGNPAGLDLPAPWNVQNRWRDKAMVATMQNYSLPPAPTEMPAPPSNYYNWYNLNTDVWRDGYIKDQNDVPVADAVIEVPWRYVLNTVTDEPAWSFDEWMAYVTDENGYYALLEGPNVTNFEDFPPPFADRRVNAAGAVTSPLVPDGTTEIVRDLLPYSSETHVLVLSGEDETYRGRVDLAVLTGTVEAGGQTEVVAGHSVHLSAPFHAEQGSEAHIHVVPVFKECREEGSGMAQQPPSPQGELAQAKSRVLSIALRFETPVILASAYPSPAIDEVTLRCGQPGFAYTIYDAKGRVIHRGQSASEFITVDISSLSGGEYRVSLVQGPLVANTSFTIAR